MAGSLGICQPVPRRNGRFRRERSVPSGTVSHTIRQITDHSTNKISFWCENSWNIVDLFQTYIKFTPSICCKLFSYCFVTIIFRINCVCKIYVYCVWMLEILCPWGLPKRFHDISNHFLINLNLNLTLRIRDVVPIGNGQWSDVLWTDHSPWELILSFLMSNSIQKVSHIIQNRMKPLW